MAAALEEDGHRYSLQKVAVGGKVSWDERMPERLELLLPLYLMESARPQKAADELKILRTFDNEVGILQG